MEVAELDAASLLGGCKRPIWPYRGEGLDRRFEQAPMFGNEGPVANAKLMYMRN